MEELTRRRLQDYKLMQTQFYNVSYALTKDLFDVIGNIILARMQKLVAQILSDLNDAGLIQRLQTHQRAKRLKKVAQGLVIIDEYQLKSATSVQQYVTTNLTTISVCCFLIHDIAQLISFNNAELNRVSNLKTPCLRKGSQVSSDIQKQLFCLDVQLPSLSIKRNADFKCQEMKPAFEPYTTLERAAYANSNLTVHAINNRKMESANLEDNSILTTYVNSFSGHVFDSLMMLSMFVVDPTDNLLLTVTAAFLLQMIPFYFHSIREVLIVYAVIAYNRDQDFADKIAQLFQAQDTIAFHNNVSAIYKVIHDRVLKDKFEVTPKPPKELINAIRGSVNPQITTALLAHLRQIRQRLISLNVGVETSEKCI